MSNTSCNRNAARSSGDSRSSVSRSATERSLASDSGRRFDHRLGQPRADVRLAPRPRRLHAVEAEPRHDPREVRARLDDLVGRRILPAQERVLHDVLGLGDRAEHAVREAHEERAMRLEALGGHDASVSVAWGWTVVPATTTF